MMKEKNNYCNLDVTILRKADMKFRDNFLQLTHVDPLVNAITIASACNLAGPISIPETQMVRSRWGGG